MTLSLNQTEVNLERISIGKNSRIWLVERIGIGDWLFMSHRAYVEYW